MTPADLRAAVLALLDAGIAPHDVDRVRRRLGEDAEPADVVAALQPRLPLRPPPPGGAADGPRVATTVHVAGVDLPSRLQAAWPAGGPLWVHRVGEPVPEMPGVAVVGTRRPTLDGLRLAGRLAADLAAAGVLVVSGLARGIDQAAHRGALEGGGRTTAVLGTGHGVDYPAGTGGLRRLIAASGGVLSEYAPLTPIRTPGQFIARNRILAGLGDAVVVIEAGIRSGALSTARWAMQMGREVLVVPASPSNPAAAGSLRLLADGARPVLDVADVLDALPGRPVGMPSGGLAGPPDGGAPGPASAGQRPPDGDARAIAGLLSEVPASPSALATATGLTPRRVLLALAALEDAGIAVQRPDGAVRRPGRR